MGAELAGAGALLGGAGQAMGALGAGGQQVISSQMHPVQLAAILKKLNKAQKFGQTNLAAGGMASIAQQKKAIPLLDQAYKGAAANAAMAGGAAKQQALSHEKKLLGDYQQNALGAGTTGLSTYKQGVSQIGSGTSQTLANIDAAVADKIGSLGVEGAGAKAGILGNIGQSYQNMGAQQVASNTDLVSLMSQAIQNTLHKTNYTGLGKKKKGPGKYQKAKYASDAYLPGGALYEPY